MLEDDEPILVWLVQVHNDEWKSPIINFLKKPSNNADIKTKRRSIHYFLDNGRLIRKVINETFLKCPSKVKA